MLWSFVYLVVWNLFALVWLFGRPRRSKELEILVLAARVVVATTILRLARENPQSGYRRIVGELKRSRISVSATSVGKLLLAAALPPAPARTHSSWRASCARRQRAYSCDLLTLATVFLQRIYVLFFISLARRRIE